ncbi:hypothetical protein ABG814_07755 [Streptococcus agalactiae]
MSKKEKVLLGVAIAAGISTLNAATSVSADTVTTSTATDNSSVEVVQKQAVVTPEMVENAKMKQLKQTKIHWYKLRRQILLSKHLIRQITMLKLLRINYLRRKI